MALANSKMRLPDATASLDQWLDWLLHLHAQEIDLGIDRVKSVALRMGIQSPGQKNGAQVISVAGTNGKGSSVAMLASIYHAAGYRVGCYTSPHILKFNERIKIDGLCVTDEQIVSAFVAIEAAKKETKLTFFEFATLAALFIFSQADLDVILLEVGLGGRLDAVNLVDADATLITAIDVDHIDWLGDDRNQIAVEKLGIARANKLCVVSEPDFPDLAKEAAAVRGVSLTCLGEDYFYQVESSKTWHFWQKQEAETRLRKVVLPSPALQGQFQLQNAAGVCALVKNRPSQWAVSDMDISQGLQSAVHFGRLQTVKIQGHDWLVDVAHNPQSAEVLARHLADIHFYGPAVFSALSDKEIQPMIRLLAPFISEWHIADLDVPRATSLLELQSQLQQVGVAADFIYSYRSIEQAVQALALRPVTHDLAALGWGSFYTVSQILNQAEQG